MQRREAKVERLRSGATVKAFARWVDNYLDQMHAMGRRVTMGYMWSMLQMDEITASWFPSQAALYRALSKQGFVWKKANKYHFLRNRKDVVTKRMAYLNSFFLFMYALSARIASA